MNGISATHDVELLRNEYLVERLIELELALDSEGWISMSGLDDNNEFTRAALREIHKQARLYYIKNPLVRRGVQIQRLMVFGRGMNVRAADEDVNAVVQSFMDDAKNQAEMTSYQSMGQKETALRIAGNLFFVFFVDPSSKGRVWVRTIPFDQVEEIVTDPEDAKSPWFYLRMYSQRLPEGGTRDQKVAYPDWRYKPAPSDRVDKVRDYVVDWGHPVYHVKTGGLDDMRFGVPETYPAHDWAKAYTKFLEDWATLTRAYSRFAHKLTVPDNKQIVGARQRLGTTLGDGSAETNPPPVTGSVFIQGAGTDLSAIRIGGANVNAEDGRRLLLMVAAAMGLPDTYFGDTAIGTLATAKSLDHPTELQMRDRQSLWADVYQGILGYVVEQAVRYGALAGSVEEEDDGTPIITLEIDPETNEPRDATVFVEFPPVMEDDRGSVIDAIVKAGTLGGNPLAGTIDQQHMSRLLMTALGVDDVDAIMDELYPEGEEDDEPPAGAQELPKLGEFAAALQDLRMHLAELQDSAKE